MTQQQTEKQIMEYTPLGAPDKIKLSIEIVKRLIAVKTRSGKNCSDDEAIKFMMMCQARKLNPFEGDAFLIGYDGRDGASFSLITAHQAFLKRAELNPEYDGMESGVVVERGGEILDVQGDFTISTEKLLGGWARVFFKSRSHPMYKRIRLERFKKNYGIWVDDPAGMICKCSEADALRSSFPTMLGGLYIKEEMVSEFEPQITVAKPVFNNMPSSPPAPAPPKPESGPFDYEPVPKPTEEKKPRGRPRLQPKTGLAVELAPPQPKERPNQVQLEALLEKNDFTRGDFMAVCERNQWLGRGRTWASLDEVPDDMLAAFLPADEFYVVASEIKKLKSA